MKLKLVTESNVKDEFKDGVTCWMGGNNRRIMAVMTPSVVPFEVEVGTYDSENAAIAPANMTMFMDSVYKVADVFLIRFMGGKVWSQDMEFLEFLAKYGKPEWFGKGFDVEKWMAANGIR